MRRGYPDPASARGVPAERRARFGLRAPTFFLRPEVASTIEGGINLEVRWRVCRARHDPGEDQCVPFRRARLHQHRVQRRSHSGAQRRHGAYFAASRWKASTITGRGLCQPPRPSFTNATMLDGPYAGENAHRHAAAECPGVTVGFRGAGGTGSPGVSSIRAIGPGGASVVDRQQGYIRASIW